MGTNDMDTPWMYGLEIHEVPTLPKQIMSTDYIVFNCMLKG